MGRHVITLKIKCIVEVSHCFDQASKARYRSIYPAIYLCVCLSICLVCPSVCLSFLLPPACLPRALSRPLPVAKAVCGPGLSAWSWSGRGHQFMERPCRPTQLTDSISRFFWGGVVLCDDSPPVYGKAGGAGAGIRSSWSRWFFLFFRGACHPVYGPGVVASSSRWWAVRGLK